MSDWSDYYNQNTTPDMYIRNLYGQREFLTAIAKTKGKRILEIGAGTGTMSIFLSQLGFQVTTLDNDSKILEVAKLAKEKFSGQNNIIHGDAFKLPFEDGSFDLIFHQGLLEHFSDKDIHALLKEHLRVASTVIFSVPNNYYSEKEFGDERLMSKTKWESILKPYNLEISQNYSPKFFPKWYLFRVPIQYMAKIS